MLIKGSTPTKEPLVSIGLILPIDKQEYVKITSKNNPDYEIKALENQLLVNGKKSSKFNLQELTGESGYSIKPVTAGRGFHWQKQIAISIKGSIKIKNIDGCLFLVNEVGIEDYKIGLCFPGLKSHKGIVVMANGPRIPNLTHHIHPVKSILNDSDCCVIGELKSTIGMMQDTRNGIYIGGGTGIADGIILNGEILNLINTVGVPRSWEINVSSNETVETLLSPAGIIKRYNDQNNAEERVLADLLHKEKFNKIMDDALKAFLKLVEIRERFFQSQNEEIEEIVIGQRLGKFFNDFGEKFLKRFQSSTKIPIKISSDRRTAALGAAFSFACS